MTSVLFLHGTGVREDEFNATYNRIKKGFAAERPDISVERCYWGEIGAKLNAGGKSFYFDPHKDRKSKKRDKIAALAEPVPDEEKELARWARLFDDPLFEMRMSQLKGPLPPSFTGRKLGERVEKLSANGELAGELAAYGLTEPFAEAVGLLTDSVEFSSHFADSTVKDGQTLLLLSRALVAGCLAAAEEDGIVVVGERRDQLVSLVRRAFDVPPDYGFTEDYSWKTILARSGGPWARRQRRAAIEQMADVVLYQAHGSGIRRFVADRIRDLQGPVVLLAHSLGGVIAFDLLAGEENGCPGNVRMLVTAGSQAPLLYELGALACGVNYDMPLPKSFPSPWINVYDKRDLLAYAGAELFPDHCQDIPLDTGMPFPMAHGAYWDPESGLYKKLAGILRAEGL